jgi:GR25 family glycosyltransferase involved in LPS biosynthesis
MDMQDLSNCTITNNSLLSFDNKLSPDNPRTPTLVPISGVLTNIPEILKYVLYINLDNRKDRQIHILKEMKKLGIIGERVSAIKMPNGAIGCTMSHIKSLELAKEREWPYVFICEDDICFLNPEILKENLLKFSENTQINWDVVIIGGNNSPPYERIADYCIKVSNNQTTTGYIVRSHYYDTLINNFRESARRLLREPTNRRQYALDMYWKSLQQSDNWYMITPPTVVQCEDYSDIEGRHVNYGGLMLDLDKPWLFKHSKMNFVSNK